MVFIINDKLKRMKIKEPQSMSLDEIKDKTLGKPGTKKRIEADARIEKIAKDMSEKLYTRQDMVNMYDEVFDLTMQKQKYQGIKGFNNILAKIIKKGY